MLITHHHADHCGGAAALKREFTGCIMIGPDDIRLQGVDDPVRGGEERDILGLPMKVIGAPGHTKTHVLFYFPGLKALFTGDTLFSAGCGRLFEGSAADMYRSLTTCAALSDDTRIYCGHEYTEENLRFALTVDPGNVAITRQAFGSPQPAEPGPGFRSFNDFNGKNVQSVFTGQGTGASGKNWAWNRRKTWRCSPGCGK